MVVSIIIEYREVEYREAEENRTGLYLLIVGVKWWG